MILFFIDFKFGLDKVSLYRSEKSNIEIVDWNLDLRELRLGRWISVSVLSCVSGVELL